MLLRLCALLPVVFIMGTLVGCGSSPSSALASTTASPVSTPPASTASTAKPKFVYTGNQGGSISGYSVNSTTGSLTPLTGFPLTVGNNPTSITHDPQNRFVFVSDISANMLHVYAINASTGALSEISPSPYNTMIESETVIVDPSGTHVYMYRTGASTSYPGVSGNQIVAFNLTAAGQLSPIKGSPFFVGTPGAAFDSDRGMVIDAAGRFVYLKDTNNLYTFGIDASTGGLTLLQTQTAQQFGGIALDPGGLYLYVAGVSSIQSYSIDPSSGLLSFAKSSATQSAYNISLSPNGKYAYIVTDGILSYALNDGVASLVGTIPTGVFGLEIGVDPSSSFVYVPQSCISCPHDVLEYAITKTGALTPLATPMVASGVQPWGITIISQ